MSQSQLLPITNLSNAAGGRVSLVKRKSLVDSLGKNVVGRIMRIQQRYFASCSESFRTLRGTSSQWHTEYLDMSLKAYVCARQQSVSQIPGYTVSISVLEMLLFMFSMCEGQLWYISFRYQPQKSPSAIGNYV